MAAPAGPRRQLWAASGHGQGGGVLLVNVRHADAWQTALAAAVAAAFHDTPQLGVENPPAGVSDRVAGYLQRTGAAVVAFGDAGLVSDEQLAAAAQAAG